MHGLQVAGQVVESTESQLAERAGVGTLTQVHGATVSSQGEGGGVGFGTCFTDQSI